MGVSQGDVDYDNFLQMEHVKEQNEIKELFESHPYLSSFISHFNKINESQTFFQPISVNDIEGIKEKLKILFYVDAEENYFNNYMSENEELMDDILTDDNNYDLIAKANSGKTYGIVKNAIRILETKDKNFKLLLLVPYVIITEQLAKEDHFKDKIKIINQNVDLNQTKKLVENENIIVSTYEGIEKLKNAGLDPSKFVIVIDELHNFIIQQGIRNSSIRRIMDMMVNFKKVIRMTGTPEGVFNNEEKDYYHSSEIIRYRFTKENKNFKLVRHKYSIMKYLSHDNETMLERIADHIADHFEQKKYKDKVVVLINHTEFLNQLKEHLIKRGFVSESLVVLSSENKDDEVLLNIAINHLIPDNIKIIMSTSVINDGVNIKNNNIDAVYFFNVDDPILLSQFIARFRSGINYCYDFIPLYNNDNITFINTNNKLEQRTAFYESLVSLLNSLIDLDNINDNIYGMEMLEELFDAEFKKLSTLYFNNDLVKYCFDLNLIKYKILKELYKQVLIIPAVRNQYLKIFNDIDCEFEDFYDTSIVSQAGMNLTEERQKIYEFFSVLNISYDRTEQIHITVVRRRLRKLLVLLFEDNNNKDKIQYCENTFGLKDFMKAVKRIKEYIVNKEVIVPANAYNEMQSDFDFEIDQTLLTTYINDVVKTSKIHGNNLRIFGAWDIRSIFSNE